MVSQPHCKIRNFLSATLVFVAITTFAATLIHDEKPTDLPKNDKDETIKPRVNTKISPPAKVPSTVTRVLTCFRFTDNLDSIFKHTPSKGLSSVAGVRYVLRIKKVNYRNKKLSLNSTEQLLACGC